MKPCTKEDPCYLVVIESEPNVLSFLNNAAQDTGHGLILQSATTMAEAIHFLTETKPDIILLDLDIQAATHEEKLALLEAVLSMTRHKVPVIALIDDHDQEFKFKVVARGAQYCLTKSTEASDFESLMIILRFAANRNRTRSMFVERAAFWESEAKAAKEELTNFKSLVSKNITPEGEARLEKTIERLEKLQQSTECLAVH